MKAGILGGGQLGRMLLQAAANYDVETYVLESDQHCPAAHLAHHFIKGNITDFNDVYAFGKRVDVLTIEIENVNIEALEQLEKEGVKIFPRPAALRIIKNKIYQKQFYQQHAIRTSEFVVIDSKEKISAFCEMFPAVLKLGEGGYDGRGVMMLDEKTNPADVFDAPCVLEKKVAIKHELACIVAVDEAMKTAAYPPVEMYFDPQLNLLDFQLCPSQLPDVIQAQAAALAVKTVAAFKSPGIFAVELFVDKDDNVWVNETAPRVHNSGHHTIEASYCSQFDMLWRIMLKLPLGNTDSIMPSALVNLTGSAGNAGIPVYEGLEKTFAMHNSFVHIYGKKQTKPGRKMGHITLLGNDIKALIKDAKNIKDSLNVVSKK